MNKTSLFYKYLYLFLTLTILTIIGGCKSELVNHPEAALTENQVEAINIDFPKAIFTDLNLLKYEEASTTIMDQLISLINATPKGASLYLSIYQFDYPNLIAALESAYHRGVNLHIMLDSSDRSNNEGTIRKIKLFGGDVEIVNVINDASESAINHNKSAIFSTVVTDKGAVNDVIFNTSHNFTTSGTQKIQDAVILTSRGLYEAFLEYWLDMKDMAYKNMKNFEYREYEDTAQEITALFFPKRRNGDYYGEDTYIELFNGITNPSTTTIKLAMSAWYPSRKVVTEKIEELVDMGASVEIITKSSNHEAVLDHLQRIARKGARVKILNMDKNEGIPKINIHSKFMLIEGEWNNEDTNILVNGTHNLSKNALRNNGEIMLLFQDHLLFHDYKAYFDEINKLPGVCCQ